MLVRRPAHELSHQDPIIAGWWMNEGGQSSTGRVCAILSFIWQVFDLLYH